MAFRLQFPFFKISMQWKRQRTLTDVLGHLNVKLSSFPCVNGSPSKLVCCPVCCHTLAASQINDHLDSCLQVKVEPPVTIELDKTCSCSEKVVEVSNYSQLFPEEYSVCEKEQKPCLADGCTLDVDYFDCEKLTAQLKVFRQELDFSLFNHRRLFIEEEMKIVQQVHSLSSRLQNLFQNILGRKNKTWHSFREFSNLWYNGSKYSEEDFYLLKDLGLIQPFQVETDLRFEEIMRILNLLNVKELKQAYRQLFLCNVEYRGKQKLILELCECLAKKVVAHGTQRRMNGQSPRKDCWNYVTSQLVYVFRVPDQVSVLFDNMHRLFYIPNSTETPLNLLAAIGRLKFARYVSR